MARDTTPKPGTVVDTTRLFFALLLGASATTTLLAAMSLLAARSPDGKPARGRVLAAGLTLLVWAAWLGGVAWLAQSRRSLAPALVVVLVGAMALAGALGPFGRLVAGVPWGVRMGVGALRVLGLVRVGAFAAGWLPAGFALGASGVDLVLGAVALVWSLRAARPAQGWVWGYAVLSVLGTVATGAWAVWALRPMPMWELLAGGFLGPLWALLALAAVPREVEAP